MWSLPDIKRMNAAAKVEAPSLEQQARTGKDENGEPFTCICADWGSGEPCEGEIYSQLWYDIFSDDPKGIVSLCEHHDEYYGSPTDGYFACGGRDAHSEGHQILRLRITRGNCIRRLWMARSFACLALLPGTSQRRTTGSNSQTKTSRR